MRDIIQKTRKDYNKIAKYFSNTREYVWPEFKYFRSFIKDGQNILDWGCGNGRMIFCLEDKKVKYYGLDQSIELIKIARKKFNPQIKNGTAQFFCTASRDKKFSEGFFDLVFAISSFFHLPDEESRLKLLQKFNNEMKDDGKLVMLVWNLGSDWAKAKAKKGWKKIGENDFLIPWKTPEGKVLCDRYYHHFTQDELKDLLKKTGFKIKKMGYMQGGKWSDDKGGFNLVVVAEKNSAKN